MDARDPAELVRSVWAPAARGLGGVAAGRSSDVARANAAPPKASGPDV